MIIELEKIEFDIAEVLHHISKGRNHFIPEVMDAIAALESRLAKAEKELAELKAKE